MVRFKEHVQSSNPKHFLSETEFVALRKELAAGSVTGSDGEEAGSPPGEELPPGTEDLADPAKVHTHTHTQDASHTHKLVCV